MALILVTASAGSNRGKILGLMSPERNPPLGQRLESDLAEGARRLGGSRRTAALTGAGLSVESGIPPFRRGAADTPGLWERYDPMEYATIEAFDRDPARVWLMLREMAAVLRRAQPNPGHDALARLEKCGMLSAVITQNVDGLHQAAGSQRVLELHGSWRTLTCRLCHERVDAKTVSLARLPPLCGCGGPMKPDVTLFGEIIPAPLLDAAWDEMRSCDCLLVVGTSADVAPASTLPAAAAEHGAFVIEINVEPTGLPGTVADLSLVGPAGIILPRLVQAAGAGLEN